LECILQLRCGHLELCCLGNRQTIWAQILKHRARFLQDPLVIYSSERIVSRRAVVLSRCELQVLDSQELLPKQHSSKCPQRSCKMHSNSFTQSAKVSKGLGGARSWTCQNGGLQLHTHSCCCCCICSCCSCGCREALSYELHGGRPTTPATVPSQHTAAHIPLCQHASEIAGTARAASHSTGAQVGPLRICRPPRACMMAPPPALQLMSAHA
jgi:hypothetical protein